MTKKIIETVMEDDFKCKCGNDVMDSGFYPSDKEGNEMEPIDNINGKLVTKPWEGYYVCGACNQVYKPTNF